MAIDNAELGGGDSASTRDRVALGDEIRKLRKARAKTLAEISSAIGRSISFISQLERGRAEIPISDLKRIALTLGVPLDWFFLESERPAAEVGRVVRAGGGVGWDRSPVGLRRSHYHPLLEVHSKCSSVQ
ncbi:helix-turn-helix transcriptional regulator [Pseudomonas sp. CBSPCBW29]|nr:helix-turn-helix transcriptional regulator [Pseudomonas sp. CBSPCBW29]